MTSRATYTYKKGVATFHIEDTIDARNMNDGISEEHNVHDLNLLLLIELDELFIQKVSEVREVFNLFINFHLFVFNHEINENGVSFLVSHAVLCVVHLPVHLTLVIYNLLELFSILEADQSIVEDTHALM